MYEILFIIMSRPEKASAASSVNRAAVRRLVRRRRAVTSHYCSGSWLIRCTVWYEQVRESTRLCIWCIAVTSCIQHTPFLLSKYTIMTYQYQSYHPTHTIHTIPNTSPATKVFANFTHSALPLANIPSSFRNFDFSPTLLTNNP